MKRTLTYLLVGIVLMCLSALTTFLSFRTVTSASVITRLSSLPIDTTPEPVVLPIYDNIWGTIYHAEVRQCDATPTITGDGSRINPYKASEHRWIAISQEMLDSQWRVKLLNDTTSNLYKGRLQYGDTVWISSYNPQINGWWVVRDTKNKRYQNSIDFLQTKGDGSLYNNDPMWNGKFDSIRIFTMNDAELLGLTNTMT